MAIWWITEALPIYTTALVPLVLFPLLGILTPKEAAAPYGHHLIFLMMGGFLMARAIERWRLHLRMALAIVSTVGGGPRRLILGFMLATFFLSMWISNTSTTLIMLPLCLAIMTTLEGENHNSRLSTALLLGVAYSASVGGMATLIGTPPNAVLAGTFNQLFPHAPPISFLGWFLFAAPVSTLFLFIAWFYLTWIAYPMKAETGAQLEKNQQVIKEQRLKLGPMSRGEILTSICFVLLILLWCTRGGGNYPGWNQWLPSSCRVGDSTVVMLVAIICFIIPVDRRKGVFLLQWEDAQKIPWGVLVLFGGGFSLAAAIQKSGLATWLAGQMGVLKALPIILVIVIICLVVTFLTEVNSNTATCTIMLPFLASAALAQEINPMVLMIPAALSASCAFMLPVATPPNAIVFASGRLRLPEMAKQGVAMNFLGAILITLTVYFTMGWSFSIDIFSLPAWAVALESF